MGRLSDRWAGVILTCASSAAGLRPMDQASIFLPSLLTAAACALALLWLTKSDKRMAVLPAPKSTLPLLGNTLDFMVFQLPRIYDWITDECARHEGRPWRLKLIGQPPTVVLSSVETFEDVMKTQFDVFEKGETAREVFKDPGGNGIFSADGEEWKAQRKVLTHLFTMQAFRETIADTIIENVRMLGQVLDTKMQTNEALDFSQVCHRFTYDTFVKVGFGIESNTLTDEESDEISDALDAIIVGVQMRFVRPMFMWKLERWLGIGSQGRMMRQIKIFDKIAYGIVNECLHRKNEAEVNGSGQDAPRKVNDIVSMFVDEYAQGSTTDHVLNIDAAFLRDTGVSMLLAGRDTTALAMVWCNLMLNKHPEIAERIREELHSVIPRLFEDREYVPGMDQVDQLMYMEAFVRETLRLYPLGALNAREANHDTTLSDGTFVAKGSKVLFPAYSLGRMKTVWGEDALEFKPERWIEIDTTTKKQTTRKVSAFQYPVFHGGPRICIGMRFAMLELKTALAYVLSKYDLKTLRDPEEFTYATALTLALDGPMMVNVLPAINADFS